MQRLEDILFTQDDLVNIQRPIPTSPKYGEYRYEMKNELPVWPIQEVRVGIRYVHVYDSKAFDQYLVWGAWAWTRLNDVEFEDPQHYGKVRRHETIHNMDPSLPEGTVRALDRYFEDVGLDFVSYAVPIIEVKDNNATAKYIV